MATNLTSLFVLFCLLAFAPLLALFVFESQPTIQPRVAEKGGVVSATEDAPPPAESEVFLSAVNEIPQARNTEIPQEGKMPRWMTWGVYVGDEEQSIKDFEQAVGKKPQFEMVFVHWGSDPDFPLRYARHVRDEGKALVIFWEALDYRRDYFDQPGYGFDQVLSGALDPYFKNFRDEAVAYGAPIILVPYSEFNGNWFPWGGTLGNNSPEKYVSAYRHLRGFFVDVPNVQFAWVANNKNVPDIPQNALERYYPGDQYVDVVGVNGFNYGGSSEQTFDQLFGDVLRRLTAYEKPIYVFSMGTANGPGKPSWIKNALAFELYKYPEVKGWLWFNVKKERDWRVTADSAALSAFRDALP